MFVDLQRLLWEGYVEISFSLLIHKIFLVFAGDGIER